jgi:hypothetical protein
VKTPSGVRAPSLKYQRPTTARHKTGAKSNIFFSTKDERKDPEGKLNELNIEDIVAAPLYRPANI